MKKSKIFISVIIVLVVIVFSSVEGMRKHLQKVPKQNNSVISSLSAEYESSLAGENTTKGNTTSTITSSSGSFVIPEYTGKAYVAINKNIPEFDDLDNTTVFETYSEFDSLGRCGIAYANICQELMPTENRGDISSVKPSGWIYNKKSNNNAYSTSIVDGGRIYNRCHLIGFQLAGENDNEKNLVTGTRYMNVDGMLPFENMIADHIKETGGHVLYRVTPIYVGDELVCRGVKMEAYSVEDNGAAISFNVFCFNVQPGIEINYATGENWLSNEKITAATISTSKISSPNTGSSKFVINENSKKFHTPDCNSAQKINSDNKLVLVGNREDLIKKGYTPCKSCNP